MAVAPASPSRALLTKFTFRVQGRLNSQGCSFPRGFCRWQFQSRVSAIIQASQQYENSPTKNLGEQNLLQQLQEALPLPARRFPWKEAKDAALGYSVALCADVLKWSGGALLATSTLSDLFLTFAGDKEFLLPLGLLIGIALAEFLKGSMESLFQRDMPDWKFPWHLISIGSFFVLLKFSSLGLPLMGRVLSAHIGNGGIMQLLWLARNSHKNVIIETETEGSAAAMERSG